MERGHSPERAPQKRVTTSSRPFRDPLQYLGNFLLVFLIQVSLRIEPTNAYARQIGGGRCPPGPLLPTEDPAAVPLLPPLASGQPRGCKAQPYGDSDPSSPAAARGPPAVPHAHQLGADRQTDTPRRRPAPSPAGACARPGLAPPLPRSLPQPLAGRGGGRGTRTGGSEGSEGCGAALKPPGRTQPDSAHPRRM